MAKTITYEQIVAALSDLSEEELDDLRIEIDNEYLSRDDTGDGSDLYNDDDDEEDED